MKKYLLVGTDWIYEAACEEDASKKLWDDACGAKTYEEYKNYCKDVHVSANTEWEEVL